jgi:hypothetical protein
LKPLWYLWSRQILNGIKRAFKSPRRLIGVLLGLSYFVGVFLRPWDKSPDGLAKLTVNIKTISSDNVGTAVFLVFLLLSTVLSLGVFNFRNTFKQSDVDVLFPTPVSSKLVMLFRLFRDYSATVLLPFVVAVFGYQPTKGFFENWQKGDAAGMMSAVRGAFIAWVLLAFAWVSISYAASFYVAKKEQRGDTIAKRMSWGTAIFSMLTIAIFPLTIYLATQSRQPEWPAVINLVQSIPMKIVLFLPHAATNIAMGGYSGSVAQSLLGFAVLGAIIYGTLSFASKNSDWMYDQAATKGVQGLKIREMMSKGDSSGILAERARMGKVKRGKLATRVSQMTLRNGWAMIYKELLIQSRTGIAQTIFFMLMVSVFAVMFSLLPTGRSSPRLNDYAFAQYFYLGLVGFMGANMSAATAYNGFAETLRRVEIIKPMPLNARQIAFYETISKSCFATIVIVVPFLVGLCCKPGWWQYHLAGIVAGPALAMALVAMIFLNVVIFPDLEDPTQRSFRGLTQLIGMVIVFTPTMLLFGGAIYLKTSPLIPAIFTVGVNIGLTVIAATLAGRFYADFNPSE